MSDELVHTAAMMGTVVTIHVVGHGAIGHERAERAAAVERAMGWFERVTNSCSRFEPQSEVARLSSRVHEPVPVSPLLFECVRFALAVADETDGAFDPTVGQRMESRGFDQEFRRGHTVHVAPLGDGATWRDVILDDDARTITLRRPLLLDLGAVAKGFAIDMAARELLPFEHFVIDAGGDLYCGGCNANAEPWAVGIRHPRDPHVIVETLRVSNAAVCTSGDYERRSPTDSAVHHILDPHTDAPASLVCSVTVVAPTAMVADALSTAAFVLGPIDGIGLLEHSTVEGFMITPSMERYATRGMRADFVFDRLSATGTA